MHARNYGERAEHIRAMPCLVGHGCMGRIVAAHVKARGVGSCGGDRRSLIPLCWGHHEEQGRIGIQTFSKRYALDLARVAETIASQLDDAGLP